MFKTETSTLEKIYTLDHTNNRFNVTYVMANRETREYMVRYERDDDKRLRYKDTLQEKLFRVYTDDSAF